MRLRRPYAPRMEEATSPRGTRDNLCGLGGRPLPIDTRTHRVVWRWCWLARALARWAAGVVAALATVLVAAFPAGAAPLRHVQFTAISFATITTGWVVGPGFVWYTADSGRHWQSQYRGPIQFAGVDAVSSTVAYAWGGTTLLATADGGHRWVARYQGPGRALSFSAVSRTRGYLVTSAGLDATSDGGRTWVAGHHPPAIAQVRMRVGGTGWALTSTDRVYKTTDGGRTWSLSFVLPDAHDGNGQGGYATGTLVVGTGGAVWVVFAGGYGMGQNSFAVYRTLDGGARWAASVAVGTAGGGPPPGVATHVSTGPMVPGGTGSSPGPLVTFGARSALLLGVCRFCSGATVDVVATSNGGLRWSRPVSISQSDGGLPTMLDLSFPTATTGWLALWGANSGQSRILVTHNAGRTWRVMWKEHS